MTDIQFSMDNTSESFDSMGNGIEPLTSLRAKRALQARPHGSLLKTK